MSSTMRMGIILNSTLHLGIAEQNFEARKDIIFTQQSFVTMPRCDHDFSSITALLKALHCGGKQTVIAQLYAGRGSSIGSMSAWHASSPEFDPHVQHILSWRLGHEKISTAILSLPLIQEE